MSGQFGQISAIDVETGIEVAAVVPAMTAKIDREALALKKLAKALAQAGISGSAMPTQANQQTHTKSVSSKRGLIV